MTNETELQATIKRMEGEKMQFQGQLQNMHQQFLGVGTMFSAMVRELLLALTDPNDEESVATAKRHAREILKQWEMMSGPPRVVQAVPPAPPNGTPTS